MDEVYADLLPRKVAIFWSRCPLAGIFTVGEEPYPVIVLVVKNHSYTAFNLD